MSVVELVIAMAILLVATAPLVMTLSATQRREMSAKELAHAVNEVRLVVDRIADDVRTADGLFDGGNGDAFLAWHDTDGDATIDIDEFVTFALAEVGGETVLFRDDDTTTSVLARGLTSASSLSASEAVDGDLASITLVINPDPAHAPGSMTIKTEVLARNA